MSILDRSESRQGKTVRLLAVHSTEGNDVPRVNDAAALRDATWWTGSSHAICDNEALLTPAEGCVPYDRAAWTLRSGNLISENIEQVGWARWTRAEWLAHPGTLENTAHWLADRSKVDRGGGRRIPLVKLSPADVAAGKWGVIGHVDWTVGMKDGTHTDPGPNYPWDVVIARAQQIVSGATQEDTVSMDDVVHSWYDPRFRENRNYAQVIHNIEDQATAANTQLAGLTAAVSTLAQAVANGRNDLTADELTAAVRQGIAEGGAAVLAAQEASRGADPATPA